MAAPPPQQTATGPDGEPVFTTTAPPAYSEKEALGEGQAPTQQPAQLGGQLPQGQFPQGQYPGAFIPQTWPQGYPVSQVVVAPPSDRPAPHDFLMLALVTTIICGILNLLSLPFGIPAIVFAVLSMNAKSSKNFPQAKRYGRNALILTILNIIFTMFLSLLIIGLITGYGCADYSPSSSRYYYRNVGRCGFYF